MIDKINKIYRKDRVTIDLISVLIGKLTSCENKINDLYKQIFLEYSSWYLDLKEREMAITQKAENLQQRRIEIKSRLLGVGTATKEMLESTVNTVPTVLVEIEFKDMTVILKFLEVGSNRLFTSAVNVLEKIKPYHLDIEVEYNHVEWGEVKRVSWGKVKKYTWGSVRDSVKGTVEGGLDDGFG